MSPRAKAAPAPRRRSALLRGKELPLQAFDPVTYYEGGIPDPQPFLELERAYERNAWAYACVFAIASNLAALPFEVLRRMSDGETEPWLKHDLAAQLEDPNEYMSAYEVKESLFSFLELTGNSYLVEFPTKSGKRKSELWPIPPHQIKPVSSRVKFVSHYVYTLGGNSVRLEREQVYHFRDFSPTSRHLGQGATLPIRDTLTVDEFAKLYNKYYFLNSGRPDAILEADGELTQDVRKRISKAWDAMHRGIRSAHRMAILDNGTKYKEANRTPKDMEYREGRKQNREEMIASYGCFPIIVGLSEGVNFATAKDQYKAFWTNTLIPKARRFASILQLRARQIHLSPELVIRPDLSEVEALRADQLQQAQVAQIYINSGFPPNTVIDALGLPFEHIEGGDEARKPPAPPQLHAPDANEDPASEDGDEDGKPAAGGKRIARVQLVRAAAPARSASWGRFATMTERHEERMRPDVAKFFRSERGRVIRALEQNADRVFPKPAKGGLEAVVRRISGLVVKSNDPGISAIVDMIFDSAKEADAMAGATRKHIAGSYGEAVLTVGRTLNPGFSFELSDPLAQDFINGKVFKLVREATRYTREQISEDVVAGVEEAVREGFAQGEAIDAIAERIDETYRFAVDGRSRTIARTEVIGSSNAGALEGMSRNGAERKEWLSSKDGDVRDTHQELDGQAVEVKGSFITFTGARLAFPGDPAAPAAEIVNCRCTVIPVLKEDA